MAKVNFGAIATDARGKLGGIVYSKNRNGAYTRKKTAPIQPRTVFQLDARANLANRSQAWRGLSPAVQDSWSTLGLQMTRTDSLGNSYNLTGQQAYTKLTTVLLSTGGTFPPSAPSLPAVPVPVPFFTSIVADASAGTVNIVGLGTDSNYVQIWATAPVSAGINFFKGIGPDGQIRGGDYKLLAVIDINDIVDPQLLGPLYVARYGAITGTTGSKISFLFCSVDSNGFTSAPLRADILVTA